METETTIEDIDLMDLDRYVTGEHHEMFTVLRREDPVHWTPEPDGSAGSGRSPSTPTCRW